MSVNVGSAIAYLDLDMSGFTSGISQARSALSDFVNSTDSLQSKFTNLGNSISGVGKSMSTSLTLPIVGVGTAATKVASDFEAAMSKVEAISGATAEEMTQLRDKAIEMGAKTKFSAKESADAFTYMAMAGWDAQQMIDGISGIMSLAAADGLDLATTSDIVTDALTAFGLQASDSAHFADVLAQASSSANTNVYMLGESFKYVAPVAGALGMSAEDVALALGLMANSGIKSSQAGTALRASLTNLVKPTETMSLKMEELDIQVENSDGTMKSLREIMDILRDRFSSLSEAEKANAAATLFGKEAMSGMLAIITASEADYLKLASAIDNASGRADAMAETMMGNLSGAIEQLKGAIETLMIKLGEALIPVIQEVTKLITTWVEKLSQLSDEQIKQIVKIAAVVAAIGPLLMILGKVITIVGSVIKIVSAVGPVITSVTTVGKTLFTGIKTVAGFISGVLIPAITSISAPVAAVIAIITALIAVGVALCRNWDEVSAWAQKTWDSIVESVKKAIDAIGRFFQELGEAISSIIEAVGNWLSNLWSNIVEFFSNLLSSIGGWLSSIWEHITSFIDTLLSIGSRLVDFFAGILSQVGEFFSNLFSEIKEAFSNMLNSVIEWGKNLISKAAEIGKNFFKSITSNIQKVGQFFAEIFDDIISTVKDLLPKMIDAGAEIITNLWNGMKKVFTSLADWVSSSLSNLFKPISNMVSKITDPIKGAFNKVTSFFSGSHANGLDYVPYNGYIAQLHQGERVLTKEENQSYTDNRKSDGGDTYNFYSPKAIDEYEAARLMKQTKRELDMDI